MIELPDGQVITSDDPIDLLTKMGAATLFGITADAIRTATVRGHVKTEVVLTFSNRQDRLIELKSAQRYWEAKTKSIYYERDLKDMQDRAPELLIDGERYRLLHPWPLAETAPTAYPCAPCAAPPCDKVWFK